MSSNQVLSSKEATPVVDVQGDRRWMSMHERFRHESRDKEADVIFIGDSVLMFMKESNAWDKYLARFHCFNFGIGDDTTQNMLWRIRDGELDNVQTKVVVLWCGTNNHGHTGKEIGEGMHEVVKEVLSKKPECKVLVLSILPRGKEPNKLRERNADANERIQQLITNNTNVKYLDVSEGFVGDDGLISHTDMIDYLHLTRHAYDQIVPKIADAIYDLMPEYT